MRRIIWVWMSAGCVWSSSNGPQTPPPPPPPAPPVVDAMTPDHGPYGTDITITGSGFGGIALVGQIGVGLTVVSATDTEIHVRVPFPAAAGMFRITGPGGDTTTPVFTPETTWTPGPSLDLPTTIVDAHMFGGKLVMIGVGSGTTTSLDVLDGTTATTTTLPGVVGSNDLRRPTRARLVSDGADGFVVVAEIATELEVITVANGTATPVDTRLSGTLIAADRDATGLYAWLEISDPTNGPEVERVRPGATAGAPWVVERGPVATYNVLDARTASDGTLVVAYGADASSVFDNMQAIAVERLAPAATAFAAAESPDGTSWDDYIASAQITLADDGARMVVAYSTQQYDEQTDHAGTTDARDPTGHWEYADTVSPALVGTGAFAYTASALATATADDATGITLVSDLTMPTQTTVVPLWPATPVGVYDDGTGALRPLITIHSKIWFPAPPAM